MSTVNDAYNRSARDMAITAIARYQSRLKEIYAELGFDADDISSDRRQFNIDELGKQSVTGMVSSVTPIPANGVCDYEAMLESYFTFRTTLIQDYDNLSKLKVIEINEKGVADEETDEVEHALVEIKSLIQHTDFTITRTVLGLMTRNCGCR